MRSDYFEIDCQSGKAGKRTDELGEERISGEDRLYLYLNHKHFRGLLKYGVKRLGLPKQLPDNLKAYLKNPPTHWTISEIKQRREKLLDTFIDWQPNPVFLGVIKALLVAGDAAGSGLPQAGKNIDRAY